MFRNEWELQDAYPRYNKTIGGQEYFVIDPSPTMDHWDGEGCVEWNTYRYPESVDITLDGTTYNISLFENFYWKPNLRWRSIETVNLEGTVYEVEDQWCWKPHYMIQIDGQSMEVEFENMNVYKKRTMWGEVYHWMLTDMNVYSLRSTWDIVVGAPEHGMWGLRAFTVVPETGAVDLDGDLSTVGDQYYVRRLHSGYDMWNRTEDRMHVEIIWNPNSSLIDDEIHVSAWMGKVHSEWVFAWNETYVWYFASNASVVSPSAMAQINATLVNSMSGLPNAGYWDIAHMARNATWADLLAKAEEEGWDWVKDNKHEWDWLWFGTQQDYMTSWEDVSGTEKAGIGLRYEFAGLSLHNGTEQTHFFIPENVTSIRLVSPGEAFGNTNATGEMFVPLNATIDFGVAYENVTGTLFPYKEDCSMWGWWDGLVHGNDFNEPNFMNKPTRATVDEMAFEVHFSANLAEDGEAGNNNASMKIDQHIGEWELPPYVIDGRKETSNNVTTFLMGNDVLADRSLAINYYVTAFTGLAWEVMDETGTSLDNNNVTESSVFDVAARLANVSFASVRLGSTYNWYKPVTANDTIRTFNVTSKTTPIGTMEASFQSESGKSSTGFEISAKMHFLSVEFPRWDGYAVYNDPELVFHTFKGTPIFVIPEYNTPTILLTVIAMIPIIILIAQKREKARTNQCL
jgi:hypothetical protein